MRKCVGAKFGHRTAGLFNYIVFCGKTFRNSIARKIGDSQKEIAHAGLTIFKTILKTFRFTLYGRDTRLSLFCLILVSAFHASADSRCELFKFRSVGVAQLLKAATLCIDFKNLRDDGFPVESLYCKAFHHKFRIRLNRL